MERLLTLTVSNEGRGLARFPALLWQKNSLFNASNSPINGDQPLWALSTANSEWGSFRGGADNVMYPNESLRIATLVQTGVKTGGPSNGIVMYAAQCDWSFAALTVVTEVVCDGMAAFQQSFPIEAAQSKRTR
jgi:hypothetical protein